MNTTRLDCGMSREFASRYRDCPTWTWADNCVAYVTANIPATVNAVTAVLIDPPHSASGVAYPAGSNFPPKRSGPALIREAHRGPRGVGTAPLQRRKAP